ncbi:MAG: hypothetical protein FP822_05770, partial [Brevundimonas sp.]|nr:hypothetical protein [Brevundimonas sp.]
RPRPRARRATPRRRRPRRPAPRSNCAIPKSRRTPNWSRRPSATPCATPWPRRCAATKASS